MEIVTITGISASVLSAVSMLPQLITILREKHAKGISWFALAILIVGLGFWIAYGIQKEDVILIVANSFSVLINSSILVVAFVFRNNEAPKN